MTWMIVLATLAAVGLFMGGTPIWLILGLWVVVMQLVFDFPLANLGSSLFEGLNSYALLAMPLFILTGDLIGAGGVARRMSNFALASLGFLRGGYGMASIGACGMFAAISGSNSATTATIGSITYPVMVEQGYRKEFAAATAAAGGTVGIIIPPSIVFIIYGYVVSLPISELFLAGIIPGGLMVVGMLFACNRVSAARGYGKLVPFEPRRIARTLPGASIGIFAIVIVLYGIYAGIFSPTEASGVTVAYCLFAGLFLTRELKLSMLPFVLLRSGMIIGMLAPLIAVAIMVQEIFAVMGVREFLETAISYLGGGYFMTLAAMMAIILICGTFLESVPVTVILAPIFAPIASSIGMDPFHFAAVFLVGSAIGFITPPYGLNLYVASGITSVPYFRIVRHIWFYLASLGVIWLIVAAIPELSTMLVKFAGLGGGGLLGR